MFIKLYDKCLQWAKHSYAVYILAFISFIESIFFPVPTALMFAPMALAKPQSAFWLAFIATITSVLGGVLAYFIGFYAFDAWVLPLIEKFSYSNTYEQAVGWFEDFGIWIVLIAGFSPIPYKILTLTAGAMHMAFIPFLLASIAGRAAQFFLIAALAYWGGDEMQNKIRPYMERIGWAVIILALIGYSIYKLAT